MPPQPGQRAGGPSQRTSSKGSAGGRSGRFPRAMARTDPRLTPSRRAMARWLSLPSASRRRTSATSAGLSMAHTPNQAKRRDGNCRTEKTRRCARFPSAWAFAASWHRWADLGSIVSSATISRRTKNPPRESRFPRRALAIPGGWLRPARLGDIHNAAGAAGTYPALPIPVNLRHPNRRPGPISSRFWLPAQPDCFCSFCSPVAACSSSATARASSSTSRLEPFVRRACTTLR